MLKHNQHVIAQQILELDVPSTSDIHNILQTVAQRLRTRTMIDIEALFDRFTRPEHTLKLERVEINLGNIDGTNWQQQFESRLVAQLTNVLEQATAGDVDKSSVPESSHDDYEQLLYFLRHGRLPSGAVSLPSDWPHQSVQALDSTQWQSLRVELIRNARVRNRLIHTLDDTALAAVVERLFGLREVQQVFKLLIPTKLSRSQQLSWRTQFWQALLNPVISTDQFEPGIVFMQRLLQLQASFDTPPASTRKGSAIGTELPEPWRDWLVVIQQDIENSTSVTSPEDSNLAADNMTPKSSVSPLQTRSDATVSPNAPAAGANGISESPEFHEIVEQSFSPVHARSDASVSPADNTPADIDQVVSVNGAGCILLHPFLEELFRSTKLLDDRDFRDEACREKAVHLLSRLTFGDEVAPEYELLLPKLLCGMAWQEPLSPIELSSEEQYACDELLDAVLRHWQALKDCSVNWMREQFFLRPSTLEQLDEGWRLTVERRAQDVLLDRLPWGLSVISLPWRDGLIYVRWMEKVA